jgi:hypothetical protein
MDEVEAEAQAVRATGTCVTRYRGMCHRILWRLCALFCMEEVEAQAQAVGGGPRLLHKGQQQWQSTSCVFRSVSEISKLWRALY